MVCYIGGCHRLMGVGAKNCVCTLVLQTEHCRPEKVELTAVTLAQA